MSWQKWVLVAYVTVSVFASILMIGKERKPYTPGDAVGILVINLAILALVVTG